MILMESLSFNYLHQINTCRYIDIKMDLSNLLGFPVAFFQIAAAYGRVLSLQTGKAVGTGHSRATVSSYRLIS